MSEQAAERHDVRILEEQVPSWDSGPPSWRSVCNSCPWSSARHDIAPLAWEDAEYHSFEPTGVELVIAEVGGGLALARKSDLEGNADLPSSPPGSDEYGGRYRLPWHATLPDWLPAPIPDQFAMRRPCGDGCLAGMILRSVDAPAIRAALEEMGYTVEESRSAIAPWANSVRGGVRAARRSRGLRSSD
jgi:hypothetical protein